MNSAEILAQGLAVNRFTLAAILFFAVSVSSLSAQGIQTELHARARVFPTVGAGAAKIERGPGGRYYILAEPESVIGIYSAAGKRVGQIPNEKSGAATIKYAVDFDIDAMGRLFVADRGANAVKIFSPDGALESTVNITAPMSVVALSHGEFAVVTLRSDHLVRVMDEHGKFVRSFGNVQDAIGEKTESASAEEGPQGYAAGYNAEYAAHTHETFAMNIGKVYSDDTGHIYFAFTALDDPTFRKYDPFGYAAYEAVIPAKSLIPDIDRGDAKVQVGANVSGMAGIGNFFSFGTMYSVGGAAQFMMNGGRGGGHGGGGGGGGRGGAGGLNGGSGGGGRGGAGTTNFASSGYSSGSSSSSDDDGDSTLTGSTSFSGNSGTLSIDSTEISDPNATADANTLLGVGGLGGLYGSSGTNLVLAANGMAGADSEGGLIGIFGPRGPGGFGGIPGEFGPRGGGGFGGPGGPGGFGANPNQGPPGTIEASIPTPPANGAVSRTPALSATPNAAAALPNSRPGENGGRGYGGHGGYGRDFEQHSYAAVVRFNQVGPDTKVKPVLHAIGVDPVSQEVWTGVGDVLVHFDNSGNRMDAYVIATPSGAPLEATSILVEPDRLLIVGDPTGIYDFARPDKIDRAAKPAVTAAQSKPAAPAAPPAATPTKQ